MIRLNQAELTIRSATKADAEQLTSWWNDGTVMEHAGFPNGLGTTAEATRLLIAENLTSRGQRCILEVNQIPIGEMSYMVEGQTAEIGIKICDPIWQNRGLGPRYLTMLIGYLFGAESKDYALPVDKIALDTNANNLRARHVYEKLGFRRDDLSDLRWQDQLGNWQIGVAYELKRSDWENFSKNCSDSMSHDL